MVVFIVCFCSLFPFSWSFPFTRLRLYGRIELNEVEMVFGSRRWFAKQRPRRIWRIESNERDHVKDFHYLPHKHRPARRLFWFSIFSSLLVASSLFSLVDNFFMVFLILFSTPHSLAGLCCSCMSYFRVDIPFQTLLNEDPRLCPMLFSLVKSSASHTTSFECNTTRDFKFLERLNLCFTKWYNYSSFCAMIGKIKFLMREANS